MTAEPHSDHPGVLMTRMRRLGGRAQAALFGLLAAEPGRGADGAPEAGDEPLLPRQMVASLSRRTRALALARLAALPCFQPQEYLSMHPDVDEAGFEASFHALFIGAAEGRALFRQDRLARALGAANLAAPVAAAACRPVQRGHTVGVYVSSRGNVFMHDLARDIADSLGAAGGLVTLRDETSPGARRPPVCLYVAPHEFFLLGQGRAWLRDDVIASAVMVNTEQPQTRWFAGALPLLLAARGVIDLSAQQAAMLAAAGVPALQVTPSPSETTPPARLSVEARRHPLYRALPTACLGPASPATPFADRPLDLAFFGATTPHRDDWFVRHAGFLADYETFPYCRPQARGPIRTDSADRAVSAIASHVCGHAKLALNLHRDGFGYFEWHRIVRLGMASGSVVVSEPCPPSPGLRPGVHYFEASARQLPDLIEWLLRTPDGRRSARAAQLAARALLAGDLSAANSGAAMLGFLNGLPA